MLKFCLFFREFKDFKELSLNSLNSLISLLTKQKRHYRLREAVMPIIIYKVIANYLIVRVFIGGGVNVINNEASQSIEKLHSLLYVTRRQFITQKITQLWPQRYENSNTMYYSQQFFALFMLHISPHTSRQNNITKKLYLTRC